MSDEQRQVAAKGVASIAVTSVKMGGSDEETRRQVLAWMQATGYIDPPFLFDVATAIAKQAQPVDWLVEDQEHRKQLERMFGVVGSSDQLLAALQARKLVMALAQELLAGG